MLRAAVFFFFFFVNTPDLADAERRDIFAIFS